MSYLYYSRHPNGGGSVISSAQVDESVYLAEGTSVCGSSRIYGSVRICESTRIYGSVSIYGSENIGSVEIGGSVKIDGPTTIIGNVHISGRSQVGPGVVIYNPHPHSPLYIENSEVFESIILEPSEIQGSFVRGCFVENSFVTNGAVLHSVGIRDLSIPVIHNLARGPIHPNGPWTISFADWTLSMSTIRSWHRQIGDELVVADLKRWKRLIHRFFRSWFAVNQDRIWLMKPDDLQDLKHEILQKLPVEASA